MARNITDKENEIVNDFMESKLGINGTFIATIIRDNGEVERKAIPNIVTADGLNHLLVASIIGSLSGLLTTLRTLIRRKFWSVRVNRQR